MIVDDSATRARLLEAYDRQLRGTTETPGARTSERLGILRLVTFAGGHGFITYGRPDEVAGAALADLVPKALAYYEGRPEITQVEWKTRGHDHTPGLHEALLDHGFVPSDPESIMIGEAAALAVDVPLPAGVTLRRITDEADVRAMSAMQDEAFGDELSLQRADDVVRRVARNDGMELWIAEADTPDGRVIVTAGRMEPVADSEFAGLWGGATRPEWRGRGIYRALTAARARAAMAQGRTLMNSDSTEYSRPILERSGFLAVSTTTPYEWTRPV